jgi:hypothetical protein
VLPSNNKRKGESDDSDDYDEEYTDSSNRRKRVKGENEMDPSLFFNATQRFFSMFQNPQSSNKSPEELSFLLRFGSFLAERAQSNPKLLLGIKDGKKKFTLKIIQIFQYNSFILVDLYSIYSRVQKLGGFNAIADNRVWKNLFEDCSEPGKNVAQGMTKRKYERILLPFEMYERELRDNFIKQGSELTISPIPKNYKGRKDFQDSQSKRYDTSSPAIEIIPLKNGTNSGELTLDQIKEFQRHDNSSNDGMPMPVHVIMRSSNGSSSEQNINEVNTHSGGQKENIPMRKTLQDLGFRGDPRASFNHHLKKQKLDILREGGLEVTPISKRAQSDIATINRIPSTHKHIMQPSVSLTSLTPVRAPKVIQSLNMYQPTNQVFKNPKDDVLNAIKGIKSNECLDLTSKKINNNRFDSQFGQRQSTNSSSQISLEDVRKSYRGSNPDLQITLVKSQQESTSSSSSPLMAGIAGVSAQTASSSGNSNRYESNKLLSSSSSSSATMKKQQQQQQSSNRNPSPSQMNPLLGNEALLAAASQLQKFQQQGGLSLFPFLSGIDVTPMRQQSNLPNHPNLPLDSNSLMSYISLYSNPLLQGQNLFQNLPAVDLLKFYNNASASKDRAPSKN